MFRTSRLFLVVCTAVYIEISISTAFAQKFYNFNFLEEMNKHPLMAFFDLNTRRFLGTTSEFRNIASLTIKLQKVREQIKRISDLKQGKINTTLDKQGKSEEEEFWKSISLARGGKNELINEEKYLMDQISQGVETPDSSIFPVIRTILRSIERKMPQDESDIVLNVPSAIPTLPPKYSSPNPYADFHRMTQQEEKLREYLSQAFYLRGLFPNIRKPVVIGERKYLRIGSCLQK